MVPTGATSSASRRGLDRPLASADTTLGLPTRALATFWDPASLGIAGASLARRGKVAARPRPIGLARRIVLGGFIAAFSALLGVVLVEAGLRLLRDPHRFYPYHRNAVSVFYPSDAITPGVNGVSYFTTNSFGTRGPELAGEPVRILTVGGSTTACTVLDDTETWPARLMEYLNQYQDGEDTFWVTNAGIDGRNSQHHLMHAIYLLPQLPELDYLILYAGLNDVGLWLYQSDFDPDYLERRENWEHRLGEAFRFSSYTPADWPWYKHSEIWKRASILKSAFLSWRVAAMREEGRIVQDAELNWLRSERQRREEAQKQFVHRAKMETLPAALEAYEATLRRIVTASRKAGVEPIFVPQAIQHQFLSEEERRRLWMGAMDGGETYVKEEQMLELLVAFNARMRKVAPEEDVLLIDLPALLAREKGLFYDGVHFNENGARLVGRLLADVLWEKGVGRTATQ
jgi:lysophospholipase L1-like esterase